MNSADHPTPASAPDLTDAFDRAGLLDVAYALEDSPLGRLLLAATPRGLVRLAYVLEPVPPAGEAPADRAPAGEAPGTWGEDALLEQLATTISPRVVRAPRRLDQARRELDEFFGGSRQRFSLPLDWQLVRGEFGVAVLEATARIPYGQVSTYGEIAAAAGNHRASRAAGGALGRNPLPIVVPCHRVMAAAGGFGGYTGGVEKKRRLLEIEGAIGYQLIDGPA